MIIPKLLRTEDLSERTSQKEHFGVSRRDRLGTDRNVVKLLYIRTPWRHFFRPRLVRQTFNTESQNSPAHKEVFFKLQYITNTFW